MHKDLIKFVRKEFNTEEFIPLHIPTFKGKEKEFLAKCIDSTFVSSVGAYVNLFEDYLSSITKTKKTVAVVNGTSALQVANGLFGNFYNIPFMNGGF